MAKRKRTAAKSTVKKRSLNAGGGQIGSGSGAGSGFGEQDAARRLGNFEGAGEHARKGGRTSGIVGQTKKAFRAKKKHL